MPGYSFADVNVELVPARKMLDLADPIDPSICSDVPFGPFIDLKATTFDARGLKVEDAKGATVSFGPHVFRVIHAANIGNDVVRLTLEGTLGPV